MKDDEDYALGSEIINGLKVCNDSAEKEVKLVADFLHLARVEKNLQNYMQAVKEDRREIPNLRKRPFTSSKTLLCTVLLYSVYISVQYCCIVQLFGC